MRVCVCVCVCLLVYGHLTLLDLYRQNNSGSKGLTVISWNVFMTRDRRLFSNVRHATNTFSIMWILFLECVCVC